MKQIAGLLVIPDNQAEVFRLTLTGKQVLAKPDARRHESLMDRRASRRSSQKRRWNCEPGTREHRMNLSRHRMIPAGHLIHDAVYLQGLDYGRSSPSTQFASRPLVLAVRDPRAPATCARAGATSPGLPDFGLPPVPAILPKRRLP